VSDTVIAVDRLSKQYRIRHRREGYATLRDALARGAARAAKAPFAAFGRNRADLASLSARATRENFWALSDVSFEVAQGEVLGIIGRNGAGKSTLLKILSRITEPTAGRALLWGRVASLLEVGTGFHPELTGRENIYLNGAILGMSKAEIRRKFDAIAAFAEVERFLDTPVKRYSSGMYVRLAFSVAAHVEPEILIADEVLAVGDAEFQKKCLGKLGELGASGRTVLLVTHNLGTVDAICGKAVLLERGRVAHYGPAKETTLAYLARAREPQGDAFQDRQHDDFRFTSVAFTDADGNEVAWIDQHDDFAIRAGFEVTAPVRRAQIGFSLHREEVGMPLVSTVISEADRYRDAVDYAPGRYVARFDVRGGTLHPGNYFLSLYAHSPYREHFDKRHFVASLNVKRDGGWDVARYSDSQPGIVALPPAWDVTRVGDAHP